jgi:hypothetical protein
MKTTIKQKMHVLKMRIAEKLAKKASSLSAFQLKIMLVLFSVTGTILVIAVLQSSFSSAPNKEFFSPVKAVNTPHIGKNIPGQHAGKISMKIFNHIERIKHYIDSVKLRDTASYNDILNRYPHILDSISFFEKLYQSQQKQ